MDEHLCFDEEYQVCWRTIRIANQIFHTNLAGFTGEAARFFVTCAIKGSGDAGEALGGAGETGRSICSEIGVDVCSEDWIACGDVAIEKNHFFLGYYFKKKKKSSWRCFVQATKDQNLSFFFVLFFFALCDEQRALEVQAALVTWFLHGVATHAHWRWPFITTIEANRLSPLLSLLHLFSHFSLGTPHHPEPRCWWRTSKTFSSVRLFV